MTKRLAFLLAATVLSATAAAASDDISVSLVLGQRNSGFHEAIACGARAAAEELGVKVNIQAAPTYSASEQIPVLNSVMATSPSAIVLDPTSSTALIAPLMEAAANGAKIVAVDTTLDDPSVLAAVVGTDNESVGRETAKALAKALEGKSGKVAQINSIPGISTVDARIRGFEEEIKNYPNLTYIGNQFASEDIPKAQQAFVSLMSAHPDLIGVVSQSNNPAIGVAGGHSFHRDRRQRRRRRSGCRRCRDRGAERRAARCSRHPAALRDGLSWLQAGRRCRQRRARQDADRHRHRNRYQGEHRRAGRRQIPLQGKLHLIESSGDRRGADHLAPVFYTSGETVVQLDAQRTL
ncbi:substrate-binding domain-containing protein [Sinorhizobium meliloti]|nr:substrate-binding domain-containing protein [Sinorhizobium meliloti]